MVAVMSSKFIHFVIYSYLVVNPISASVINRHLHHAHHAHHAHRAVLPLGSNGSTPIFLAPVPTSSEVTEDVYGIADDLKALASALGIDLEFLFPSSTGHHHPTSTSRKPVISMFPTFHPPMSLQQPVPFPTATGSRIPDRPLTRSISFHLPPLPPHPSETLSTIFLVPTPVHLGHTTSIEAINVTIDRTSFVHITRTLPLLPPVSLTTPFEVPNNTKVPVGPSITPIPPIKPSTESSHFTLHLPIPISVNPNIPTSLPSTLSTLPTPSFTINPIPHPLLPPTSITPFDPLSTPLSLRTLCTNPSVRTISLPLLSSFFGPSSYPSLRLFPGCTTPNPSQLLRAPGLLNCSSLGTAIQSCQDGGVKVLLTVLGATVAQNNNSTLFTGSLVPMPSNPNITVHVPIPVNALPKPSNVAPDATQLNLFTDLAQADEFAATLWSLFGGGHEERADLRPLGPDAQEGDPEATQKGGGGGVKWWPRPLGDEVVLDGFDVRLDRAWDGSVQEGLFGGLVARLRSLAGADKGRGYEVLGVSLV